MKPPAFEYVRPKTVDEAIEALARHGGDAKILAGGQSLVPMMNFRLARPSVLVDVNRLGDLAEMKETAGGLRVGALVRHRTIETSPVVRERFPVLAAAAAEVGHLAIRNRGTFGGTLAHNDPAAEFPMIALLLNAVLKTRKRGGGRTIAAADFFTGPLTTALEDGEMLVEVELPWLPAGTGWGFEELSRRHGDFAIAAAAATVTLKNGACAEARLVLGGVGPSAFRPTAAETMLAGKKLDAAALDGVKRAVRDAADPFSDIHGSAEYRREVVGVLAARALERAWERATR